tara:strand:- start:19 stop:333 length:315 start_codon:yes stop_codon:yes gene_type:complete
LFCPKCDSLLVAKKKGGKNVLSCSCGYSSKDTEDIVIKEENKEDSKIEVVDKKIETLPKTEDEECKKCGTKEAYYWLVQTRAGDEAETRFFRCTKCEYTWRAYS